MRITKKIAFNTAEVLTAAVLLGAGGYKVAEQAEHRQYKRDYMKNATTLSTDLRQIQDYSHQMQAELPSDIETQNPQLGNIAVNNLMMTLGSNEYYFNTEINGVESTVSGEWTEVNGKAVPLGQAAIQEHVSLSLKAPKAKASN